ncbi:MAG: AAA family ATPase [Planctomycetaceae bacterium]
MNLELPADFLVNVFKDKPFDIPLAIDHALREQLPGSSIVMSSSVDVQQYEKLGLCSTELLTEPKPLISKCWGGEDYDQLFEQSHMASWRVQWNDVVLFVLYVSWETSCGHQDRSWVIAETEEVADNFMLDVARKTNDPGDALLVFSGAHWGRSRELYRTVQQSSFDDLILDEDLKTAIREDFGRFLKSEQQYVDLGLSWRRGALLIGPPGNGKTHCVRALVKELGVPAMYVQSLKHQYLESEQLLKMVFDRARELRPSVLIMEDLDSLVDEGNQSFFLNQLDGFEKNHGLILLATTNHPDRIDSAIIDRPSRFDRKYHFHLPTEGQRQRFLESWRRKFENRLAWSGDSILKTAETTNEFSFAYLKELVISSLLCWNADQTAEFDVIVEQQRVLLAGQMRTTEPTKPF